MLLLLPRGCSVALVLFGDVHGSMDWTWSMDSFMRLPDAALLLVTAACRPALPA